MTTRICICGKIIESEDPWCSDRCRYIVEKLNLRPDDMYYDMAIKLFGDEWDKEHKNE